MQENMMPGAQGYVAKNKRRRVWQKIVGAMAGVVVFCTTYALILPAITMEKPTFCGMEEHTHEDKCYIASSDQRTLTCSLQNLGVHTHSDSCKDADGNLICGQVDYVVHTHDTSCYDETGAVICQLPEVLGHTHTDSCYSTPQQPDGHIHSEDCYTLERGELACEKEESEGHDHGDDCYAVSETLVCLTEESEGHTHGDECYTTTETLTCQMEESEEHTHGPECSTSVQTLICQIPESAGHAHGPDCYEKVLTCEIPVSEGYQHTDECYTWNKVLSCGLEEIPVETTVEPTEQTTPAAEPELICTEPVVAAHVHSDSCYTPAGEPVLECELEEHEHKLICYSDPEADVETASVWQATLPELNGVWAKDVLAVAQSQLGYQESTKNYTVLEDGETMKGYTRYGDWYGIPYGDWCAMFVSFCLDHAGVEGMTLNSVCANWIVELSSEEYGLYHSAAEYTPRPGDVIFFDWEGDGKSDHVGLVAELIEATETEGAQIRTIEGNSGDRVQYVTYSADSACILGYGALPAQLSEEDRAAVDHVISLIDEMPSADEIDAKLIEFDEAGDIEGEEAWYAEISQQVALAYHVYSNLPDELKPFVTNADKLLELEYIWSVTTLELINSIDVYQVNSYASSSETGSLAATIVRGARGTTVSATIGWDFNWWYAVVVEQKDGQYVVTEVHQSGVGLSKANVYAPYDGFILLVWSGDSSISGTGFNVEVGDYVSTGGSYFWRDYSAYTGTVLGTVKFFDAPVDHATPFWSEPTQVTQNIADTDEFIELNLYDYGSNINTKFKNETYTYNGYTGVTLWPGFQWNGGAYNKNSAFHRHQVDYIDFGNSLITDLQYVSSSEDGNAYGKASGSVSVGKTYNYSDAYPGTTGIINRLWRNGTDWGSLTNRPIGMSMNSGTTDTTYDVLKPILTPAGYPVILSSDYVTGFTGVLDYLFTDNTYAKKVNGSTINGLFQINPTSGEYYFNSRWNHAQYDAGSNTFKLYEEVITPNFIVYPFGNFLPFNKITDGLTSANVKNIEAGTLKNYLAEEVSQKLAYADPSEAQLRHMLSFYRTSLNPDTAGSAWHTYGGLNAIQDYFWGDSGSSDDAPSIHTSDIGELVNNGDLYNIDFDVHKNFFFGMDMSMRFYQPKDGMTGNDNGNNAGGSWSTVATNIPSYRRSTLYVEEDTQRLSGSPDGIPDYPMKFYFTGDDDVWVFIDGMLFLDLTGIHRHVGGEIDFQKGVVNYYELDVVNTGDISKTPYQTFTFKDLVTKAIKFRNRNDTSFTDAQLQAAVNEIINPATGRFYDYSIHEFKFFYMERGSGSSVCRMNFNFPLLKQNTLSVSKELTADADIDTLGNPDFKFQILDVDEKGTETTTDDVKTEDSFLAGHDSVGSQWAYTLYDRDGSLIQEVVVTEKHADGTVKELCVYNYESGTKKLVRKEYEKSVTNDDGSQTVKTEIEDYPDNGKVYTIDQNGILTLKAGQRAEFTGIPENWGRYYVRELLDASVSELYGQISVSGVAANKKDNAVEIDGITFDGVESPILDMGDGSSTFTFDNRITTEKLAQLSITKELDVFAAPAAETTYKMHVELDGKPIPVGTSYTVGDASKTVVEEGVVEIAAGETATIANIIAGTRVKIWEDSESAEGYTVKYDPLESEGWTQDGSSVSGVVLLNADVAVKITNAEKGTEVTIPGTKSMTITDNENREFIFRLDEVDADGNVIEAGVHKEATATAGAEPGEFQFLINYATVEFDELPAKRYYKITEAAHDDTLTNSTVYTVEVTISQEDTGLKAEVTKMWKDDAQTGSLSADFVNTLTGALTLEKEVAGGTEAQSKGFSFSIFLSPGTSGLTELPATYPATFYQHDGTTRDVTLTRDENGCIRLTDFKHGEKAVISGIPLGAAWTITEDSAEGFVVKMEVRIGDTVTSATGDDTTRGDITTDDTLVLYINQQTYALPETGAAGTISYTMAGLMLMLLSAAFLLYRYKKRGREGV